MSTEENKALMRRFLDEVFNKKRMAAIDEFIPPNHVDHTLPAFLPTTPEGTKRAIGIYLKAFPDLHVTVEDMIAGRGQGGHQVYVSWNTEKSVYGHPPNRQAGDRLVNRHRPRRRRQDCRTMGSR